MAVIVTSRTAVANRASFPEGTCVVSLAPFDQQQIAHWLRIWNNANADYFQQHGLRRLTPDVVDRQAALAGQPLLLLMLALYDADSNALRSAAELGQAELYERLVRRFVERELDKAHPRAEVAGLVERELVHLACVAFSMFNRGRQWATSTEFDQDLKALKLDRPEAGAGFAAPLSPGDLAPGKFFFVHEARATRDKEVLHTYEFLHATFGEFLIARLVAALLNEIVGDADSVLREVDDGLLRTLLSWATLSSRRPVIAFLQEFAKPEWQPLIVRLFRRLESRDEPPYRYRPWEAGPQQRFAYYSANLVLLALVCGDLRASTLMPGHEPVIREWRGYALLWRSQCAPEEWTSLTSMIDAAPELSDMALRLAPNGLDIALDPLPDPLLDARGVTQLFVEARFCYDADQMALFQAILPFINEIEDDPGWGRGAPLRGLLEVLELNPDSGQKRRETYLRAIKEWNSDDVRPLIKAILGDLALISGPDRDELLANLPKSDVMQSVAEARESLR
ncbi:hypothetical protein [Nonomuraea sp. NPDC049625]|uniref:hypothetical protein n=1 Tax=Nonomuraea sp. NPDC049625 TaxID=3155775 RepID=UPI003439418A